MGGLGAFGAGTGGVGTGGGGVGGMSSLITAGTAGGSLDGIGQMKAGLETLSVGLDRAMVILQEIRRMDDGLFVGSEAGRSEGMDCGLGGLSRLECELNE
jgi:hypothetical protein